MDIKQNAPSGRLTMINKIIGSIKTKLGTFG